MLVHEIMEKEVEKTTSDMTVTDAAKKMVSEGVGYLIIVEGAKLAGIVTEDDIIKKVVAEGKNPHEVTLSKIMVKDVIYARPKMTLEEIAQIMTDKKIKKVPIVEGKHLLGIVTAAHVVASEPKMMQQLGELIIYAKKQKKMAG